MALALLFVGIDTVDRLHRVLIKEMISEDCRSPPV